MKKITILVTIILLSSVFMIKVNAQDISINELMPNIGTDDENERLIDIGGKILGIIQVAGSVISVIVLIILGIKYMFGSIEEKVQFKKTMMPYTVGAVLLFSTSNILGFAYSVINDMTHQYVETDRKTPTCTEEGYVVVACKDCGKISESTLPATGHSYRDWETKYEATCTEGAKAYRYCTSCGDTESKYVDSPLGHNYTRKTYISKYQKSAATCQSGAVYYYRCIRCDASSKNDTNETYVYGNDVDHQFNVYDDSDMYVKDEGIKCQTATTYYYKCQWCDAKGTEWWTGPIHDFKQIKTDAARKAIKSCTSPEIFYESCGDCGTLSSATFSDGIFGDHDYSWYGVCKDCGDSL